MSQLINVYIQNERGEILYKSNINFSPILEKFFERKLKNMDQFPFIQFIDFYGNTYFNYLQIPPLKKEILEVMHLFKEQKEVITELENLKLFIDKVKPHLYLKFIGD